MSATASASTQTDPVEEPPTTTLTWENESSIVNEVACRIRRIQGRFDADPKGCKQKIAGARCGGKLTLSFDPYSGGCPVVQCDRHPHHGREAYDPQFDRFIKPELERFDREQAVAYPARVAAAAKEEVAAAVLGHPHDHVYCDSDWIPPRPNGPFDLVYLHGEWEAEGHFQRKRKGDDDLRHAFRCIFGTDPLPPKKRKKRKADA